VKTEEGSKNALVMPFLTALGYNVFDPMEVTPELIADVGVKKGEKVDYAVLRDGEPIMLFECKILGTDLGQVHASQLYRYFSVTSARFGVLTDGTVYRFYSDLEAPNKMDDIPFFIFDMREIKEGSVEALKRFTKSAFDEDRILTVASELKYKNSIRTYIESQFSEPSEAFVRFFVKESKAYSGHLTQSVIEDFTPITRDALRNFVSDQVEKRLKTALATETEANSSNLGNEENADAEAEATETKIVTTQEEIDAFLVVKAIIREVIDVDRIFIRDTQSYCSVLVDDNNRRPICRLRFNHSTKYLGLLDDQKNEERVVLDSLNDIYKYADNLKSIAKIYSDE
ncbi:MAG: type I restriction enzyme HsdR N-terminal domain-containing protein, partial [Anaerolineae bacterium]|nr:type I restriction enzyme HsdR N-terminal domain-containing protein [Anaerolineae bacterium]